MRKKALEATHPIPYKLIQSLSSLPSNHSITESGENIHEVRIERDVKIRIENDILKKGRNDSILVNVAVI